MASAPPEPPQSVVLASFDGIRNTVAAERLKPSELAAAVNVDIDDAGQLRRRRGYRRVSTANHHSLTTLGDITLVVRDGVLGTLVADLTFTPIVPVGTAPLTYVRVADTVYFSGESISGKITNGSYAPWGTETNGLWLSPVMRPTETLGAIAGKLLGPPPRATLLELYKGRIYLGHERLDRKSVV